MDDDPNILDLDFKTFSKITNILENQDVRNSLLEVLDPNYFNMEFMISMDVEGRKSNMTPAKYLLFHMGSYGIRVSQLCSLFEAIKLEKALVLLKKEEPLQIIEQPLQNLEVQEGTELRLKCIATSYPPPEYRWFKGEEELLLQQDPVLLIQHAKPEDSGIYCCQVLKQSGTNQYSWLNSEVSQVEVIAKDNSSGLPSSEEFKPEVPKYVAKVLCGKNFESISSTKNKETIFIKTQPCAPGRVPQGMSIYLRCEAESLYPVNYQWFQNGRPLLGQTSSRLDLMYLCPDPIAGDTEWEYKCELYNEYDHVFSRTVIVKLDDANENTQYFAAGKKAFMVANDSYFHLEELKKPAADVADLGQLLSSMNFQIFAFKNLNLTEMKNALHTFCQMLKPNDYALFFFAGHGFEDCQTYLQPVDCSSACLPHEAICSEYILQCMQETKPAMNVLLIDSCRNLCQNLSDADEVIPQGKIYKADMKNNTIYGYSTSFLYSSHESDSEPNSVYVKYLKRYITQNKKIQDVLNDVLRDFESNESTKNLQHPMIKSTLTAWRKLCDPVFGSSDTCDVLKWTDIKREHVFKVFEFSQIGITFLLEFQHHMNVFCNGLDVNIYVDVKVGANSNVFLDLEVDVLFDDKEIKNFPSFGVHLKNIVLNIGEKNLVLKKQVLDLQKIKSQDLKGKILLKFCSVQKQQELPFSVDVSEIAGLELSLNQLKSYNIEKTQQNLKFKNCTDDKNITINSLPVT